MGNLVGYSVGFFAGEVVRDVVGFWGIKETHVNDRVPNAGNLQGDL